MIRRATEKDIPRIGELLYQVQDTHAQGRPDIFRKGGRKFTDQQVAIILKNERTPVYVFCDEEDRALAHCFCELQITPEGSGSLWPRRTFYIHDLCVDEACRRQGIGKALYGHAEEEARRLDCDSVTLHVWECNPKAAGFYEKMGLAPLFTSLEKRL